MKRRQSGHALTFIDATDQSSRSVASLERPSKWINFASVAEGVGFEPTMDETAHNGFRAALLRWASKQAGECASKFGDHV